MRYHRAMSGTQASSGIAEPELRALFDSLAPKIRRYVARMVGEAEAEDVTQEVFARAHRSVPTFRGEARLAGWLMRIATNAAIDRLRSPWFRQAVVASPTECDCEPRADVSCAAEYEQMLSEAETKLIREEMRRCILGLVSRLPEGLRAVILLGDLQGLKDREVALALGIRLEAAKIRLHRARKELKSLMERWCLLYRDERNELACEPKGSSRA